MFGKIIYISDTEAHVEVPKDGSLKSNIMNMHVIFEDEGRKVVGEVEDLSAEIIKIRFLGEIENNIFIGGVIRKPTFNSNIRLIDQSEVGLLLGDDTPSTFIIGESPLYDNRPIRTLSSLVCKFI